MSPSWASMDKKHTIKVEFMALKKTKVFFVEIPDFVENKYYSQRFAVTCNATGINDSFFRGE